MFDVSDRQCIDGPLITSSEQPSRCIRCDTEVFYECGSCNAIHARHERPKDDACPNCGQTQWIGPRCICSVCDCGQD